MNIKSAKNFVTSRAARKVLIGQKHSPTVLLVAGTVGFVATTVLASRATLRLDEVTRPHVDNLDTARQLFETGHKDYSQKDYREDVVKIQARRVLAITRLYGPAITVGALSVCALGGSHIIMTKRNAGLVAAYTTLDKSFKEYRSRVVEAIGEDKEHDLRFADVKDKKAKETPNDLKKKGYEKANPEQTSPYARFFDEYCSPWKAQPEYNLYFLRAQQQYANDMLKSRGHVLLNDVYEALGMPRSKAGCVVGWVLSKDGDNYIDFGLDDAHNPLVRNFVNGMEPSVLLDFNVDGVIYDKV